MFKLFRKLEAGERIIIAGDPADGGNDPCAAQAYSLRHHDYPFVFNAKMACYIKKMTGEFPMIAVEKNTGSATLYVLMTYNYPNLFRMPKNIFDPKKAKEESDTIGWVTSSTTRMLIVDGFALALKQHAIKIYDIETVKQCMTFIINPKGKPQAANGSHDDLVIAAAIALKVAEISPKTKTLTKEELNAKIAQFPRQDLFDDSGVSNV
jgi:hypothetical protein